MILSALTSTCLEWLRIASAALESFCTVYWPILRVAHGRAASQSLMTSELNKPPCPKIRCATKTANDNAFVAPPREKSWVLEAGPADSALTKVSAALFLENCVGFLARLPPQLHSGDPCSNHEQVEFRFRPFSSHPTR